MARIDKDELQRLQYGISRKNGDLAERNRDLVVVAWIFFACFFVGTMIWFKMDVPIYIIILVSILFTIGGVVMNRFARNMFARVGLSVYIPPEGHREKVYDHSRQEVLAVQGKYEEACQLYEEQLKTEPEDIQGYFNLAKIYSENLEKYPDAIKTLRRVQNIDTILDQHYIFASRTIADIYFHKMDEFDRAITEYHRLIRKYPDKPIAKIANDIIDDIEKVKEEERLWEEEQERGDR